MDTVVSTLVREGRFKAALDKLQLLPPDQRRAHDVALREAELLVETGELTKGFAIAERTRDRTDDTTLQILAARIMGQATFYQGDVDRSRLLLRKARDLAFTLRRANPSLYASVLLVRWRLLSSVRRAYILDSDFDELRRAVFSDGFPQHLAELHVCVAEVEARKHSPHEALRHLKQARQLLQSCPNHWLDGMICNHTSNVFAILGDIDNAFEYARAAIACTDRSGHFRIRIAAHINLAELEILRGRPDDAEAVINSVLTQVGSHVHLRTAALDAAAKTYLAKNDLSAAKASFRQLLELKRHRLHGISIEWNSLSEQFSRARILEREGRVDRAADLLARGVERAHAAGDRVWETKMRLRLAQLSAQLGNPDTSLAHLFPVVNGSNEGAETVLEVAFARAAVSAALGNNGDALTHYERGRRVSAALGVVGLNRRRSGAVSSEGMAMAPAPAALDDAVALLELAGYPHVLAREAYALLDLSGAATALALIARGESGIRCVAALGWTDADAVAAAAEPADRLRIVCGVHRDETWEILAEPKPSLNDRCTGIAIRKLVDTAVTLDRYRREEKQRAALWPADTFETDGGLWISEQMSELLSIARRVAPADITVLLTGETGTGKEVLARAIHRASGRAARPFVPFNCTAVPREMLESQLFGFRKGAFTGADNGFEGVIRAASGGTLFLDEIAEIGPDLQPKLLRFLETHEVHGLGEAQPVHVDVRIIAATNADLETLVSESRFREDLFYRLNVARLRLPPLRERREEIPPLIDHYLRKFSDEQNKGRLTLDDETLEYLVLYSWPGNVRQLVNEISRVVAYADANGTITPGLLSPEIQASRRTVRVLPGDEPEIRVRLDQPLNAAVDAIERVMILRALDRSHGNYENAARLLGISRKGLFLKRRRWGLQRTAQAS
jgi:DNA-binding NtrC family response regulator/tetratricopeptide (TPR) repeat protein